MTEERIKSTEIFDQEPTTTGGGQAMKKQCPKCGKAFKPSGLAGHLRFVHGTRSEKASRLVEKAKPDTTEKSQRVLELVEILTGIRRRQNEVDEMDKSNFFRRDEVCDELREALKLDEETVLEELRALKANVDEKNVDPFLKALGLD